MRKRELLIIAFRRLNRMLHWQNQAPSKRTRPWRARYARFLFGLGYAEQSRRELEEIHAELDATFRRDFRSIVRLVIRTAKWEYPGRINRKFRRSVLKQAVDMMRETNKPVIPQMLSLMCQGTTGTERFDPTLRLRKDPEALREMYQERAARGFTTQLRRKGLLPYQKFSWWGDPLATQGGVP